MEQFVSAPSAIDEQIEAATIEDYVVALPPFAYQFSLPSFLLSFFV